MSEPDGLEEEGDTSSELLGGYRSRSRCGAPGAGRHEDWCQWRRAQASTAPPSSNTWASGAAYEAVRVLAEAFLVLARVGIRRV